ncbi:MAG: Zn-ribbon domain-containing OB-fold protein [Acidisphaera sp.]|nr:Zn-ribbon domain-containing OB-fold protein [Acidisphaera sp.]
MSQDRTLPPPESNPETKAYWDAAAEGRLILRKCTGCGKVHFYPRALCPFCYGDTEWVDASGRGTIYSYSVMRRAPVPYAIGYVTLEEGVSMLTNFVDCDLDALKIGQDVRVVFKPTEGGPPLPMFTPARA